MMRRMCIEALYRRPNTSKPCPGHKIYPYLLRGLAIERPNQVWCDGHHLHPDGPGVCLSRRGDGLVQPACSGLAGVDHAWTSISAWRPLQEALARHGRPEIFKTIAA